VLAEAPLPGGFPASSGGDALTTVLIIAATVGATALVIVAVICIIRYRWAEKERRKALWRQAGTVTFPSWNVSTEPGVAVSPLGSSPLVTNYQPPISSSTRPAVELRDVYPQVSTFRPLVEEPAANAAVEQYTPPTEVLSAAAGTGAAGESVGVVAGTTRNQSALKRAKGFNERRGESGFSRL